MLTKLLRDLEQTNIPFYISSSSHLCRPFNHKILDVALLRLWFCSIRDDKSDPNLSVKTGISVYSKALIAGIRLYQFFISPLTGRSCRFYPTCSHYSIQSLQQYGAFMGVLRSLRRIAKCHPFHPGGYDPVK